MKVYSVTFTPEAEGQLVALYGFIAKAASPVVAERYTAAVVDYCEGLRISPERGARRDDIRVGLRITNYKGRAVIAFAVGASHVTVIGIYYGGLGYEEILNET